MSELTTHKKLLKILNAQWSGGFMLFAGADIITLDGASVHFTYNFGGKNAHVLEVLLSPQGLKAAYGDQYVCADCGKPTEGICKNCEYDGVYCPSSQMRCAYNAHAILDTWLSSNGDAAAMIDTACNLLPNPR